MIKYKNVLEQLKDAGYSSYRIRAEKLISQKTLQNIREGKMVNLDTIDTICHLTGKKVEDIIEFIPELHIQVKAAIDDCINRIIEEHTPENYNIFEDLLQTQIKIPADEFYKKLKLYMEEKGFFGNELLTCSADKINMNLLENIAEGKEIHIVPIPQIYRDGGEE